ncbi:MAG: 3-deoxy-D-manno-octulosonic acid transferase [Akkermansiaceae bacterium]
MSRPLVLLIYNIALPLFFVFAFPAWLVKMWKRGGYGTGLLERFALFKCSSADEPKDVIYVHAVSVGEVLIGLKLIAAMLEKDEAQRIVIAATTSTGHAVAREKSPKSVRVIYSPLDFNFIVRAVFRRFSPQQIVLIESEAWPNLLRIAQKKNVPVAIVNARLSARSEARFRKFNFLIKPVINMVSNIGVQNQADKDRFSGVGVEAKKLHVTGSIKFDPSGGQIPQKRDEFHDVLDDFGNEHGAGRPVLLLASTHQGEEKILAEAVKKSGADVILVIVPRHAERRMEVIADLKLVGYEPLMKTQYISKLQHENACLVADTTGELRDWTAHADFVVIGKSWLGEGGQNPAEAIAAEVPVICGPNMGNFQPLVSQLCERDAIFMPGSSEALIELLPSLVSGEVDLITMSSHAKDVLNSHQYAIEKTLELLEVNASVR